MTKSIDQFFADHGNGTQKIFNHGFGECVAVANAYEDEVVGGPFITTPLTQYAKDWWNNYDNSPASRANFDKIGPGATPQKGDVVIWQSYAGGLPHIAIVNYQVSGNLINCYTQSARTNVSFQNLVKNGLAGYLRPKRFAAQATLASAPAPAPAPTGGTRMVRLKGDFRTGRNSIGGPAACTIRPNQYGGQLDYAVLDQSGDWVKVATSMFGEKWFYTGPDGGANSLTEFFNA